MFVLFWDMLSGGGLKEDPYGNIYIEADSEEEAKIIFYNIFGHNPERVSCTCCGKDYAIYSGDTLEEVSEYHRKESLLSEIQEFIPMNEYVKQKDVLVIYAKDIGPDKKVGEMPEQGYVWVE